MQARNGSRVSLITFEYLLSFSDMQHSTTTSLAAAIVCLVLVALASLPAVSQTWRRYLVTSRARDEDFQEHYKDEDGVATKETESAFSDLAPRLLLALGSIVGALDSLAMAILATLRIYLRLATQQWLHFATWVRGFPSLFHRLFLHVAISVASGVICGSGCGCVMTRNHGRLFNHCIFHGEFGCFLTMLWKELKEYVVI